MRALRRIIIFLAIIMCLIPFYVLFVWEKTFIDLGSSRDLSIPLRFPDSTPKNTRTVGNDSAEFSPGLWLQSWPIRSDISVRSFLQWNCPDDSSNVEFRNAEETLRFQNEIYKYQNPFDCSSRRFLLLPSQWGAGFGVDMHMRAKALLQALNLGRIFLETRDQEWIFRAKECTLRASPECYFLPISNCSIPKNWKLFASNSSSAQFLLVDKPTLPSVNTIPLWHFFQEKSVAWWYRQLFRYLMRPNFFLRHDILAPAARAIFPPEGSLPERFGSVFIRQGDKGIEAAVLPVESYMDAALRIATELNVSVIYLASDSQAAIDSAVKMFGTRLDIRYQRIERLAGGWNDTWEFRNEYPEVLSRIGRATVIDQFLSANAMFFVGTISSYQCKLIETLRLVSGNTCLSYHSLD